MEVNKLKKLIEKYNLTNIIKVIVILIILYLIARLFIPTIVNNNDLSNPLKLIEGFTTLSYTYYGNQLSLQDSTNIPIYSGNTCTLKFDGVYRIEALKLIFNNNPNVSLLSNPVSPFSMTINNPVIYIQYVDGNGNLRYVKSSVNSSPPSFYNNTDLTTLQTLNNNLISTPVAIPVATPGATSGATLGVTPAGAIHNITTQQLMVSIGDITDENNLVVYTSTIVITVGDATNKMDTYIDKCNIGYISNFAVWGSTRDMLSHKDFESLSPTLSLQNFANGNTINDTSINSDTYTYTTATDLLLYGISINYLTKLITATPTPICVNTTNSPFKLSILYNNGLYAGNNFNINTSYIVRNDPLTINTNTNTDYIIFAQPIIANKLVINIPRVNVNTNPQNIMQLVLNGLQGYGCVPTTTNISDYKSTINALLSASTNGQSLDICPSVDDLVMKQGQAQQICDNLEYQDKVKSEKLRLEKNKQYLLKLQQQQQQIDQLNQVIQTLDSKRQGRAQTSDMARVLQYQQQKGTASTIRDLANQRLQSQGNNQLYLDVNLNSS